MNHSKADDGVLHAILNSSFQTLPVPISQKIGFPLLVQRPNEESAKGLRGDNQHATWLMIDPVTGFAPTELQGGVGNVIVARADRKSLDTATLGAVTDYICDIVEASENGVGAAQDYYNRGPLDLFIVDHWKEARGIQSVSWGTGSWEGCCTQLCV